MVSTNNSAVDAGRPPSNRSVVLPRGAAFWLVGLVSVLLLVSSTVPSPMYVIYQQQWGFSAAMITLIFGIYALFVLGSMLLFGSLSDTVGRKPVLVFALVLMVVAMVLFIVADSVAWLLVARAIQGIGVGIATGTLGAALIELSPNPGRGMLVNTTAPTLGMALGALGSGLLVQFAPAPTVLSYAILLVVFVVLGVLTLTLPETAPSAGHGFKIVPRRISVPKAARRAFGLTSLSIVAVWAIGGLYLSLGPSLVAEMLHSTSHVLGGLVVTGLAGGGTVAQLLFRKLPGNRPIVLGGILLLIALALVTISLSTVSVTVFFIGTVVLGLGWGSAFMGAFRSMAALADPAHRGELLAAVYTVAYLAMSVPSIIAGIVVPHAGLHNTTNWFIVVVAVLVVVALASLPFVNRHHRSGAAGAHEPTDHHAPAPCCLPTTHAHPVAAGAAN